MWCHLCGSVDVVQLTLCNRCGAMYVAPPLWCSLCHTTWCSLRDVLYVLQSMWCNLCDAVDVMHFMLCNLCVAICVVQSTNAFLKTRGLPVKRDNRRSGLRHPRTFEAIGFPVRQTRPMGANVSRPSREPMLPPSQRNNNNISIFSCRTVLTKKELSRR